MTPHPTHDDEALMRRIDGELSPEAAAAIDRAAGSDPALAARLDAMRRLRTLARDAVPIAPDPHDADLARLIAAAAPAKRSAPRFTQALRGLFSPRQTAFAAGLAAACFVVGLSVGWLSGGGERGFVVDRGGAVADAGLVRVLDTRLTAEGADAQGRAVGLTFRDSDGHWCRTFQSGASGVAGLACREGDRWTLRALAPFTAPAGELRTAAADMPAPVLAAVDATIAGETLDATAEAEARDAGWR